MLVVGLFRSYALVMEDFDDWEARLRAEQDRKIAAGRVLARARDDWRAADAEYERCFAGALAAGWTENELAKYGLGAEVGKSAGAKRARKPAGVRRSGRRKSVGSVETVRGASAHPSDVTVDGGSA